MTKALEASGTAGATAGAPHPNLPFPSLFPPLLSLPACVQREQGLSQGLGQPETQKHLKF